MSRARQFAALLFLAAVATLFSPHTAAQELKPTGLSYWDSTNQVLFFANCGADRVVRAYADGRQRGADIDIFKDFPGVQECYVDSVTAGPDGTTLIAALLNFGKNRDVRELILTYGPSGELLKTWDPAPQYIEVIAYSNDDDAVFILGGRDLPNGPYAHNYPLLVEYSRDGHVLKVMVPAGTLKDGEDSFRQGGEVGQTALRITKDQVYFYAPTNREVVVTDCNGVVLAYRSISDIIEKIGMVDGFHLVQIHALDFSDDGNIVLELLRSNDLDYTLEVFRINVKSGEAVAVHNNFNNGKLRFVGLKDGQYIYIEKGQKLVIQPAEAEGPLPLGSQFN